MTGPSWAAALAGGDTRTWREFRTAVPGAVADPSATATAGQLEVLRRLAMVHASQAVHGRGADLPGLAGLARLVLATPAAGRGAVDVPLTASGPDRAWGPRPVEPDTLEAAELLRVAVPVLARVLPPAADPPPPRRTPLRAPRFVVHGAPGAAAAVAAALTGAGWVHGPFRATHLVLACPLEEAVEQQWAGRIGRGGTRSWRRTWRALGATDAVPVPLDGAATAARVAAEPGTRRRTQLVVAADAATAVEQVCALLGLDPQPVPGRRDPAALDLHRRLNALPGVPGTRDTAVLADVLLPVVRPGLAVPRAHRAWAAERAGRLAAAVAHQARSGNYPVHGDLGVLAELRPVGVPTRVDPADTLACAIAAIAVAWRRYGAGEHDRTEG